MNDRFKGVHFTQIRYQYSIQKNHKKFLLENNNQRKFAFNGKTD